MPRPEVVVINQSRGPGWGAMADWGNRGSGEKANWTVSQDFPFSDPPNSDVLTLGICAGGNGGG